MQYANYVLYAAPFMIGSFILNMCLRSKGSATYSMIGIGFGGVLNCFLAPLFIYTFDLGVAGASMATAISKCVSFFILCMPYIRETSICTISIRKFKVIVEDAKEVIAIGSSSCFRSLLTVAACGPVVFFPCGKENAETLQMSHGDIVRMRHAVFFCRGAAGE